MELRLLYRGPLHANGGIQEKQAIRRALHPQLAALWEQPPLAGRTILPTMLGVSVGGFRFVPLISSQLALVCHLDVLFLRPGEPGQLIAQGGDMDNRLKTLFDAIRVPKLAEIPSGDAPRADEEDFYCLLEDDSLITSFTVISDRLLEPAPANHVSLVLHVVTKATEATWGNVNLG